MLANEGKVVFLRNGSQLIRVISCRICKMGNEWRQNNLETSQHSCQNSDVHSDETRAPEFSVSYPELSGDNSELQSDQADICQTYQSVEVEGSESHSVEDTGNTGIIVDSEDPTGENSDVSGRFVNSDGRSDEDFDDKDNVTPELASTKPEKTASKVKVWSASGEWKDATVVSRAGKATEWYQTWFDIPEENNFQPYAIDLNDATCEIQSTFFVNCNDTDVLDAKLAEIEKWKAFAVFETVPRGELQPMSTRWVITESTSDKAKKKTACCQGF